VPFANAMNGADYRPFKEQRKCSSGHARTKLGGIDDAPTIGPSGSRYISDDGSGSIYWVTWDGK